jgi:signal peptidase
VLAALHVWTGPLRPRRAATRVQHAARRLGLHLAGALRKPVNVVFVAVLVVVAAGWWVALRPASLLDGPASFLVVKGTSMLPTLHTGDLVLAEAQSSYQVGDLVVYAVPSGQIGAGDELIHRIVGGSATAGFVLQGDNNPSPDPWTVPSSDVLGKEAAVVPGAGRWLLVLRTPLFAGLAAAAIAAWLVLSPPAWLRPRRTQVPSTPAIPAAFTGPPGDPDPPAARAARPPTRGRARAPVRATGTASAPARTRTRSPAPASAATRRAGAREDPQARRPARGRQVRGATPPR